MKRALLAICLAVTILTTCSQPVEHRPNILLIVTDDQRYDTINYIPRTKELIFDQGVTFTNAYVTTPMCCPSRASILTGMYAHTHGVRVNSDPLLVPTFVARLQRAGYFTGIAGKYLNSWALHRDEPPRPEFDFWVAHGSLSVGGDYFAPRLNVSGTWVEHEGYFTYVVRDYALDFLREAENRQAPFLLIFAPYAPHDPADPAPGDEDLYADLSPFRPPGFNESDVSDKPEWVAERPPLTPEQIEELDAFRRKQLQSLNAVDEAVESLLLELERQGVLDDTVVIYLSDNGISWGEHRLDSKGNAYETATHVPFALRYPPLVAEPRVETRLIANIDIAPTIYDLAGIPIPSRVDGLSLVPLLSGRSDWRDYLLLEGWPTDVAFAPRTSWFTAIRTADHIYIQTSDDRPELYDLVSDPYQLNNEVLNPEYAEVVDDLKSKLEKEQTNLTRPSLVSGAIRMTYAYRIARNLLQLLWANHPWMLGTTVAIVLAAVALLTNYKRAKRMIASTPPCDTENSS